MDEEKYNFHLEELKKYKKNKFGVPQIIQILDFSRGTFNNIIEQNDLHRLPKFKKLEHKRKDGSKYDIYKFDIIDTARFLAEG